MVEWGGLENRCGFRVTVGSNPTLSASCKNPPITCRLHFLPDLIRPVVWPSDRRGSATENARPMLGVLVFNQLSNVPPKK